MQTILFGTKLIFLFIWTVFSKQRGTDVIYISAENREKKKFQDGVVHRPGRRI